jgi:hypothetical protein
VAVPILIFIGCMVAGVFASARWLPALEAGSVGGLAFFVVCGLVGVGVGLIGLHIYEIVESTSELGRIQKGPIVAADLTAMLFETGFVFGIATTVYLLAPAPPEPGEE